VIGESRDVAVIIAAHNSSPTIGRAVSSALSQPEAKEVIVVDDASQDDTAAAAMARDDGSGRLRIIKEQANRGPAAARNRAIEASGSSYVAILDADDYFLPNRFAPLFQIPGWDLIADNVAFISEGSPSPDSSYFQQFDATPGSITFAEFVAGNISHAGRPRAELGFMKPVVSRAFLAQRDLVYDETLRLGEDYALTATMLASGARFVRSRLCGYVAVERADSLSGRHRTEDLEALLAFDDKLVKNPALNSIERRAVRRHRAHVLSKVHHRRVLDRRRQGLIKGFAAAFSRPALLPELVMAIARDKLQTAGSDGRKEVRYLFN
jgi:succinoglycan biosynthesis protein ExoU